MSRISFKTTALQSTRTILCIGLTLCPLSFGTTGRSLAQEVVNQDVTDGEAGISPGNDAVVSDDTAPDNDAPDPVEQVMPNSDPVGEPDQVPSGVVSNPTGTGVDTGSFVTLDRVVRDEFGRLYREYGYTWTIAGIPHSRLIRVPVSGVGSGFVFSAGPIGVIIDGRLGAMSAHVWAHTLWRHLQQKSYMGPDHHLKRLSATEAELRDAASGKHGPYEVLSRPTVQKSIVRNTKARPMVQTGLHQADGIHSKATHPTSLRPNLLPSAPQPRTFKRDNSPLGVARPQVPAPTLSHPNSLLPTTSKSNGTWARRTG